MPDGRGQTAPAARRLGDLWASPFARAFCCLAVYLLCAYLVALLYGLGLEKMLTIWGVTGTNLARAPQWIQFLYRAHAATASILGSGAALASLWGMGKLLRLPRVQARERLKGALWGAGAGVLAALSTLALYRLFDLARFGGLSRDALLPGGLASTLLAMFLSALAAEALLRGRVYALLRPRDPRLALAVSMALQAILSGLGSWNAVGMLNAALLGALCCALYARYESILPGALLTAVWEYVLRALAGFPAGAVGALSALWECYPVSEALLTGGSLGYQNGLLTTALLLILLAVAYNKSSHRRRNGPC